MIAGPKAGIIEHSIDGSDWVEQDLSVEKNSFKLHLNRIYILRDGLDPDNRGGGQSAFHDFPGGGVSQHSMTFLRFAGSSSSSI